GRGAALRPPLRRAAARRGGRLAHRAESEFARGGARGASGAGAGGVWSRLRPSVRAGGGTLRPRRRLVALRAGGVPPGGGARRVGQDREQGVNVMSAIESARGRATVMQPLEGDSFWQPVPANGHADPKLTPANTSYGDLSMGYQTIAPGSRVREHAHG